MPVNLRPSEVHGDAGAQCGALCCPRRRAGLTFASKGQSRRNVSARAGRQDALILFEAVAPNLALWCKEYSNYVYW
jgi:hypothetical protein